MSRFLSVIPVEEARKTIKGLGARLPAEEIPLNQAIGRILASDISSDIDIPGFDRSTVDGYAVRSADTIGAGDSIPSMLRITGNVPMGEQIHSAIIPGSCMYIPTGAFLPPGADAVVMIEYCESMGDQALIHRPVAPGENVISQGEDFKRHRTAVNAGTCITSRVAGVLAACGASTIKVITQPKVAIISTGNELVGIDAVPDHGKIRDVNSYLCAGFVIETGGIPAMFGIIPDDASSLESALNKAVSSCDLVLISGGSSKGERDMCADIIASRGEVFVHGVALSPGKPTIIGVIDKKPVIGLPGHPASAYIVLLALVRDLFQTLIGTSQTELVITATLTESISSVQGREDYIRGRLSGEYVTPVLGRSGLTNTLLHSDGVIRIPSLIEGYEAGAKVEFLVW